MNEVGLVPLVHLLTGLLHVLSQSRWSTAEHTNFTHLKIKAEEQNNNTELLFFFTPLFDKNCCLLYRGVDFLERAEERDERRTAKVGYGPQAGEEAAVPHLLEVAFTHILPAKKKWRVGHTQGILSQDQWKKYIFENDTMINAGRLLQVIVIVAIVY